MLNIKKLLTKMLSKGLFMNDDNKVFVKPITEEEKQQVLNLGGAEKAISFGYDAYFHNLDMTTIIYGNNLTLFSRKKPAILCDEYNTEIRAPIATKQMQSITSASADLAANTYIDKTINFSAGTTYKGKQPIVAGWNVTGTGTANVQCMGAYISGSESAGYVAHVKIKNNSSSSIGPVTATVYLLWL